MLSKFVRSYGAVKRVLKRRFRGFLLSSLSGYIVWVMGPLRAVFRCLPPLFNSKIFKTVRKTLKIFAAGAAPGAGWLVWRGGNSRNNGGISQGGQCGHGGSDIARELTGRDLSGHGT